MSAEGAEAGRAGPDVGDRHVVVSVLVFAVSSECEHTEGHDAKKGI